MNSLSDTEVKSLSPLQIEEVAKLNISYPEMQYTNSHIALDFESAGTNNYGHYLIQIDGQPAGKFDLSINFLKQYCMFDIDVFTDYQGRGFSTDLLRGLATALHERGYKLVTGNALQGQTRWDAMVARGNAESWVNPEDVAELHYRILPYPNS